MTSIPFQAQQLTRSRSVPQAAQPVRIAFVPLIIILGLWEFSPNSIDLMAGTYAFILVLLPWWSYSAWKQSDLRRFPLFSIVSTMYVIAYVLPLFLGPSISEDFFRSAGPFL